MLIERKILFKEVLIFFDLLLFSLLSFFLYQWINGNKLTGFTDFPFYSLVLSLNDANKYTLLACFILPPLLYLTISINGLYAPLRSIKFFRLLWRIFKLILANGLFGLFILLTPLEIYARLYILTLLFLTTVFLALERCILYFILHLTSNIKYNPVNLLVIGKGKRAVRFIDKINSKPESGYRIYGIIDDEESSEQQKHETAKKRLQNIPVLGYLNETGRIITNHPIDEVVLVVPRSRLNSMEDVIHYICTTHGIKVNIAADLFDFKAARTGLADMDGWPMLTINTIPGREWQLLMKRIIDVAGSLTMLFFLLIPMVLIAFLIKLTSPGPVLFVQKRVGLNGKLFQLYKFRSMYKDADKKLHEFLDKNIMNGPVFKMKDDPRVTSIGKIIRKYSIDELPQLFNVLAGHMSLVGPRPNLITEVKKYKSWQMRRLSMRPGITCLWQINGRNNTSFDYWMKKDLTYLDEWSLILDFKILYKTMPAVLKATGAY